MTAQISMLEDDVAAKMFMINEITMEIRNKDRLLEEKIAEIDDLAEKLECSKRKNYGLKAAVQDLFVGNKGNIKQMTMLEKDGAFKRSMIDVMSMDIQKWSTSCEEKTAEIATLYEQLELSKTKSDGLKLAVQELTSDNTNHASELENLMSSMQEMVDLNGALQA